MSQKHTISQNHCGVKLHTAESKLKSSRISDKLKPNYQPRWVRIMKKNFVGIKYYMQKVINHPQYKKNFPAKIKLQKEI